MALKIKYNEIKKSIKMKDGLKAHYFVLQMLMFLVLNLLIAFLNLFYVNKKRIGFFEIF